jgi:hypothetical protein
MVDVVERLTNEGETEVLLCFHCPGCKYGHSFRIKGQGPVWDWNGSLEKPTFAPSLLVWQSRPEARCHSFVRDGNIEFLGDCFHELKNQTVPLPPVE